MDGNVRASHNLTTKARLYVTHSLTLSLRLFHLAVIAISKGLPCQNEDDIVIKLVYPRLSPMGLYENLVPDGLFQNGGPSGKVKNSFTSP